MAKTVEATLPQRPPSGDDRRAAYYRVRADECFRLAEASHSPELRDQWLHLANQWTFLLVHNRQRFTASDD